LLRLGLLVRWRLVGFLNGRCRRGLRLVVFLFVVRLLRLGLFVRCRLVGFLNGRCRRGLRLVVRLFLVRLLRLGLLVRCGRSSFLNGRRRRLRFLVFLLVVCRFLGVGRALRTGRWQRSDRRDGRRLDRSAARDVRRDAIGFAFVRVAGRADLHLALHAEREGGPQVRGGPFGGWRRRPRRCRAGSFGVRRAAIGGRL